MKKLYLHQTHKKSVNALDEIKYWHSFPTNTTQYSHQHTGTIFLVKISSNTENDRSTAGKIIFLFKIVHNLTSSRQPLRNSGNNGISFNESVEIMVSCFQLKNLRKVRIECEMNWYLVLLRKLLDGPANLILSYQLLIEITIKVVYGRSLTKRNAKIIVTCNCNY